MRQRKLFVAVGSVLSSAAFAHAGQFGTLNDNFGNDALNVPGGVGPGQANRGPYDPYEFSGVSTSELDPSANQGVPRNWLGINNSSGQVNSTNGGGTTSGYYADPWTGYAWNQNDGAMSSNDATPNTNFVSTGDRATGGTIGIANNWLVSAPVKFVGGQTISFMANALAANQDFLELRISTFATAAAALAAPNTGVVLTGSETYNGMGGTPNDGSSYQNVGDFKTVIGSIGTLDGTGQPATTSSFPTTWTLETMTIPASANGLYGRLGFYYFDQAAGQSASTSYAIGVDNLQSNLDQLQSNVAQWGLAVAPTHSWNSASNWSGANPSLNAGVPSGQGAQVLLGSLPNMTYSGYTPIADSGNQVISLDAAQTVGQLTFDNASDSYTIAAGTGGSLNVDDTGDPTGVNPQINVLHGTHSISAPIVLTAGVNINVSTGTNLTVSNTITGPGTVAVNGGGTFTVGAGGVLPTTDALTIATGSKVVLASGASATSQTVASLTIDTTTGSLLDLGRNILNITGTPVATIKGYIGVTNPGIYSSLTDSHHNVGYMPVGSGSEVRYTLLGDTNLDGSINFTDLLTLAQHYGQSAQAWYTGDTNYDGTINFTDLLNLAQNYGQSVPANSPDFSPSFAADWNLAVSEASAVPEPASLGLLGIGAMSLLARRRRTVSA